MYNVGDVVLFLSKDPIRHLNVMFGRGTYLSEEEIQDDEYVGVITNVSSFDIGVGTINLYNVSTIRPIEGLNCTVPERKITRVLYQEEWTEDEYSYFNQES